MLRDSHKCDGSQVNTCRPKVIFVASWYPNEDHPLNGIFIQRHARAILPWCDVGVVYVHQSLGRTWSEREVLVTEEDGIKTVRVYLSRSPFGKIPLNLVFERTVNSPLLHAVRGIGHMVRELGGVDLIHLNVVPHLGLAAALAARYLAVPLVTSEHSSHYHNAPPEGLQRRIGRWVLESSRVVLPVSRALARDLGAIAPGARFRIVPNIVDTSFFVPPRGSRAVTVKRMIHVSLLRDSDKNVSGLLAATRQLKERRKDFELHIVGDGPDRSRLEDLSRALDLSDVTVFHGRVDSPGLRDLLQQSHVFVLNSRYETFSIVGAEALACGVPVVSTRCGGPEDYLDGSNGILIDVGDTDGLVAAMDRMLDSWDRYDGEALHASIAEKYSAESVGQQLVSVYDEVIGLSPGD